MKAREETPVTIEWMLNQASASSGKVYLKKVGFLLWL